MVRSRFPIWRRFAIALCLTFVGAGVCTAQRAPSEVTDAASELRSIEEDVNAKQTDVSAPDTVEVEPRAGDDQIAQRLEEILQATQWFRDYSANVVAPHYRTERQSAKYRFENNSAGLRHDGSPSDHRGSARGRRRHGPDQGPRIKLG